MAALFFLYRLDFLRYNRRIMVYLLCFVAGAAGYFLNMVCGFGAGIFSMMFLPYVMESTVAAAALVNILSLVQGLWICWFYRKKVRWRSMIVPLIAYFAISTLTVHFAKGLGNHTMQLMLGALLVLLSIYFLFFNQRIRLRDSIPSALAAGGIGGVMSALFSIGGPPISLYYSAVLDDKEEYLATIQTYFMFSNIYMTAVRVHSGVVTKDVLVCSAVALVGMVLGTWAGKKVFDRINGDIMRKLIYIMMAVSGIIMLLEALI